MQTADLKWVAHLCTPSKFSLLAIASSYYDPCIKLNIYAENPERRTQKKSQFLNLCGNINKDLSDTDKISRPLSSSDKMFWKLLRQTVKAQIRLFLYVHPDPKLSI